MANYTFRAINSFGISGLLEAEAEVFYSSLFSPKNVGRVSDLLAAKIRETGVDELRLRAAIETLVFAGYASQVPPDEDLFVVDKPLPLPLVLEAGVDSEKICIGVNYGATQGAALFGQMIERLRGCCDQVIVRRKGTEQQEIVAVVSYPYAWKAEKVAAQAPVTEYSLEKDEVSSPPVASYIQLGDLDYHQLLSEDLSLEGQGGISSGEWLAKVSGRGGSSSAVQTTISGDSADLVDRQTATIVGDALKPEESATISAKKEDAAVADVAPEPTSKPKKAGFGGFLKKMFSQEEKKSGEASVEKSPGTPADDVEAEAQALVGDGLDRLQSEGKKIMSEIKGGRAKAWVEGLVSELAAEKTRIQETLKKAALTYRQKEIEFVGTERSLTEEVRRKDDQLRQRQSALQIAKDQVAKLQEDLQRARSGAKTSGAELQLKKQIDFLKSQQEKQRLELEQAKQKLAEAKNDLPNAKVLADSTATKEKLDKTTRQNEDFRRQNAQLISRVNELEKRSSATGNRFEEMKGKVEQAATLLQQKRQELEAAKKLVGEREVAEMRLKRKIAELEAQIAIQKKAGSGGGRAA